MKWTKLLFVMAFVFCCSCNQNRSQSAVNVEKDSTNGIVCTNSIDDWHQGADTIVGDFSGEGIDTLVSEAVSWVDEEYAYGWYWHVRSLSGNLPTFDVCDIQQNEPRVACKLVSEGDLNGDGKDEFGILSDFMSNWEAYYILSYDEKGWRLLTDPISVYECFLDEDKLHLEDVARPSGNSHSIQVHYSTIKDIDFLIVDTTFQVKMLDIKE